MTENPRRENLCRINNQGRLKKRQYKRKFKRILDCPDIYIPARKFKKVPRIKGTNPTVKRLFIEKNKITKIPDSISDKLPNLEILSIKDNKIKTLPDAITELNQLKQLSITSSEVTKVPATIGNLSNLTGLSLGKNKLKTVPNTIAQLENLDLLNLSHNKLSKIPPLPAKEKIKFLLLDNNPLSPLPTTIGNLTSVLAPESFLSLNQLNLTSLPPTFSQLKTKLKELQLNKNKFITIPEEFREMTLWRLELNDNEIEYLPDWIGNEIAPEGFSEPIVSKLTLLGNPLRSLHGLSGSQITTSIDFMPKDKLSETGKSLVLECQQGGEPACVSIRRFYAKSVATLIDELEQQDSSSRKIQVPKDIQVHKERICHEATPEEINRLQQTSQINPTLKQELEVCIFNRLKKDLLSGFSLL